MNAKKSQRQAVKQGTGYQHLQRGLVITRSCQHFASQPLSLPSPSPCKTSSASGFKVCYSQLAKVGNKDTAGICSLNNACSRLLTKTCASTNCTPFGIALPFLLSGHRGHCSDCDRRSSGGGVLVKTKLWLCRLSRRGWKSCFS